MSPLDGDTAGGSTRRKRQHVGLFELSGLTEDERRRVRQKQRQLLEKIETGPQEEHDNDINNMTFLSGVRDENNELFNSVFYTREAVLDADNTGLIVQKTLLEVDKLRQVRINAIHC